MNKKLFLKTFCLFFLMGSASFAETKSKNIIANIRQAQDHAEKTTVLDDYLDATKKMEEENREESLGINPETQKIVSNLKNPFIPQFPPKTVPAPVVAPPIENKQEFQPLPPPVVYEPPPPTPPELKMSGLVWNTNKPQAIVNGQVVGIGDMVQEWEITAISQKGIEVQKENHKIIIEQKTLFNKTPDTNPTPVNIGRSYNINRNTTPLSQRSPNRNSGGRN